MVSTASANAQLDELLQLICVRLQLTPSQYNDAASKYQAIGSWLSATDSSVALYRPDVYPQGSFRIGTTVRPLGRAEFDIDLVCEVQVDASRISPMALYQLIQGRLRENETYRRMLELKNRCLRLNYAGQFHMDILPACPNPAKGGTAIVVPDREARSWKSSNPKAYAEWFDAKGALLRAAVKMVQPLPGPQTAAEKTPLQRAVQLIKRQRDIAFGGSDLAPRSIVLTTLAAHSYDGQPITTDAVSSYLTFVGRLIEQSQGRPFVVLNPTDGGEVLSEKWQEDANAFNAFVRETGRFANAWQDLLGRRGLPSIAEGLNSLFGEDIVAGAMKDYAERLANARGAGAVGIAPKSTLILGSGAGVKPIPRNTNYGCQASER